MKSAWTERDASEGYMLNIEAINERFVAFSKVILKFRAVILVAMVLILAISFYGLKQLKSDTDDSHYFNEGDELLLAKDYMASIFGNDNFCAVLVHVDNVFTPHVLTGIREMGRELEAKVPYVDDVISVTDMEFTKGDEEGLEVSDIVPDPVPDDPTQLAEIRKAVMAKPSLRNQIVSEDGRYAWIMVRLKHIPSGTVDEHGEFIEMVIGRTVNEIAGQEKYAWMNPETTGWPVINLEKRDFMAKEMPKLIGLSLLSIILVLALVLRNVRSVIFPVFLAGAGLSIVLGIQGLLGVATDPMVMLLPIFLSISMAICYSLYFINFFRWEFQKSGNRLWALEHAVGETGWPIFFSASTTMASLLSFCFVNLRPIKWVGMTSASMTMLLYVLTIVLLPVLFSFGGNKKEKRGQVAVKKVPLDRLMEWMGSHVLQHPRVVFTVAAIALMASVAGLFRVEVAFDLRRSFGTEVPYIDRICRISETPLGSLYSFGVGIEFPNPDEARLPENLRKLEILTDRIREFPLTKKVHSVLDVVKDLNQVLNAGNPESYTIPQTREEIAQVLLLYENAGGTEAERWIDYEYRRLRVMIEIDDYNSGEAVRELEAIRTWGKELFPDARVILTGTLCQFTQIQDYVSWGQVQSILISMVVISLLMAVVFGSLKIGLIAMIPNILPAFFVCAVMGFFNIPLDMMTVTVIPMILGLAVDDTIHFINHCQLEFMRTGNYRESIRTTFMSTGKAMLLTSSILCFSFSAYMFSKMIIFVHMGILVIIGIFAAFLSDYFITPNLIVRLRVFGEERSR